MRQGELYQISMISLGVAATALLGYFFYHELFPEYRIYQEDYVALENFRSTYTGQPAPDFRMGVKQIVLLRDDKGPPTIDRCVSCHVALQFEHFSPTKLSYDRKGQLERDSNGIPRQIPNDQYVWDHLDAKILELKQNGDERLAKEYESLKTAHVGEHVYDVTKVLRMHPLMGRETRPFEYHPIDEYGCVSCHNGNGRGLTTEKAHGPVFDGQYEIEDVGHTPSFLEVDPQHDPLFSKVFNHKPGHELLFQTSPLYVGALMQAKCIQCHQTSEAALQGAADAAEQALSHREQQDTELTGTLKDLYSALQSQGIATNAGHTSVDLLTQNYSRGRSLFISQACYACHRIAGLSRGGVGPELTREGYSYPWFVKESIVWPQADLKTSTMPNYRMDHRELEDMLTFLLAQTGETKIVAPNAYKIAIQEWENGKKLPWEKASTPSQIQDLDYSMTLFATEGCAACHRLVGFKSDVGFAVEANKKEDFDALYREKEWFRELIPETITGSELAAVIEKNAQEIDARILHNVHEKGLLNTIASNYPETIESYYSNFRFASRVKTEKAWTERLQRILMIYVQEYGLGRVVGPRPNWSGVYRSDEWLMEHFKNPSAHVPRSIMPVFPFDETKFYALTHMLDILGLRNRDANKEVWTHKGFNPETAFQMYCAQCHGANLHGTGPVAEWIYPVPKNLRNSDFLRNLTRERAIQSITHGVKGTPMAPWGEVATDKPAQDGVPVLSPEEIHQLVDWIYAGLPGGQVLRSVGNVPKWEYMPKNVLQDLKKEGNFEKFHQSESEIFDITASPILGVDQHGYYIKKEYYTPENLAAGQQFFELNCAACHGRDADGSGLRAGIMDEAKPRMLVNFDWIQSKDDLNLIRSIKFGVPGTAMNPWGDLTNSLQRLQLVMFIRTLSEEKKESRLVDHSLYAAFDREDLQIERIRATEYGNLDKIEKELAETRKKKNVLYAEVVEGSQPSKELLTLISQELELVGKLNRLKEQDQLLVNLKTNLKQEKEVYGALGRSLIQLHPDESALNAFALMVKSRQPQFKLENGKIVDETAQKIEEQDHQKLLEWIHSSLANLEKEKVVTEGKIVSNMQREALSSIAIKISSLQKLQAKILSAVEEGRRLRSQQQDMINTYNAKKTS